MTEKYRKPLNLDELKKFIQNQSKETKFYLGCDSERFRIDNVWYADYIRVLVAHIDGHKGCKIFGEVIREIDYDQRKDKPRLRLMTEAYKVTDLYLSLANELVDRHVEIHLDINPNVNYASSAVVHQATGYIKGVCNITPEIKPNAYAASYAADRYKEIVGLKYAPAD